METIRVRLQEDAILPNPDDNYKSTKHYTAGDPRECTPEELTSMKDKGVKFIAINEKEEQKIERTDKQTVLNSMKARRQTLSQELEALDKEISDLVKEISTTEIKSEAKK
ncbi:MAG: hypothetical protein ABIQ27_12935 [Flavobacterium sp.]|uniref:hypothetical protein n=1 Tax=Flavobacterium sp. TaxID=239 RepID=UPI0032673479